MAADDYAVVALATGAAIVSAYERYEVYDETVVGPEAEAVTEAVGPSAASVPG